MVLTHIMPFFPKNTERAACIIYKIYGKSRNNYELYTDGSTRVHVYTLDYSYINASSCPQTDELVYNEQQPKAGRFSGRFRMHNLCGDGSLDVWSYMQRAIANVQLRRVASRRLKDLHDAHFVAIRASGRATLRISGPVD